MLAKRGLLGLTRRRRGTVSPFFVKKKKGQQRLVLDCRAINQLFRKPRRPEMGPAESIQRMQTPEGQTSYEADADLKNCFYQC